ncbi:MAG: hypothetical protein AAGE37_03660 [Pseudomonadota bacterium]
MTDLENEKRKQRRLAALGTNEPKCPCCGETDWRVFEQDHIAGRARDDMVVNICANCHRKRTYDQKGHPPHNPNNDPQLDMIGHFLLGLADLLKLANERLSEFGLFLIALSENDDHDQVQS